MCTNPYVLYVNTAPPMYVCILWTTPSNIPCDPGTLGNKDIFWFWWLTNCRVLENDNGHLLSPMSRCTSQLIWVDTAHDFKRWESQTLPPCWHSWGNMPHMHRSRLEGVESQSLAPCLTTAGLALGSVSQPSICPLSLQESCMMAATMCHVQEEARAQNPEAAPGSLPDIPGVLPCGKFVRQGKSLFTKGAPLSNSAIPSTTLCISQDDLLLIPERSHSSKLAHYVSTSDRAHMDWEEMVRRGLKATSVMDSLLGGLVGVLKDPEWDAFQLLT